MFEPKGCVSLTAAVDRLAEARRTAGQANDDGKNAAQVELRAELYSGSMLAMVVSPNSGDTFAIRPQHADPPDLQTLLVGRKSQVAGAKRASARCAVYASDGERRAQSSRPSVARVKCHQSQRLSAAPCAPPQPASLRWGSRGRVGKELPTRAANCSVGKKCRVVGTYRKLARAGATTTRPTRSKEFFR